MKESRCCAIMSLFARSITVGAISSSVLLMGLQTAGAQSPINSTQRDSEVVTKKRVKEKTPGNYQYESQYEMTKDGKGNFHSTYESQKTEWFCCLNWFSSEDEFLKKAEKS